MAVVLDISVSLDGFLRAAHATAEEPLGRGGERLHAWAFESKDPRNAEMLAAAGRRLGAIICGRRTYEDSIRWWGADGPSGKARVPLFVVTHTAPSDVPKDGVYAFVTKGIEEALRQARTTAGDRSIAIMGGADVGQQFLRAGLVDEISLHVAPVIFGAGTRLFDGPLAAHITLDIAEVLDTPEATRLRYRVRVR